jgi:hypothetical protein
LTEAALLSLALPDKMAESAIKVKLHNVGMKEATQWVGKNHRRYCPKCADYNQISLMIAAHAPDSSTGANTDDLPPLAR